MRSLKRRKRRRMSKDNHKQLIYSPVEMMGQQNETDLLGVSKRHLRSNVLKQHLRPSILFNLWVIGFVDWILSIRNISSVQLGVYPLSNTFLLYLLILTLSPTLNLGLHDNCFVSPYRLKYTVLSFFFLLASTGVILMELWLVLLYCSNIFMSRYWVLTWTLNCFHILVLIVRFHLSHTLDFSSFSVEYSVMSFFSNSSLIFLL